MLSPERTLTVRTKHDIPVEACHHPVWEPAEGHSAYDSIDEHTLPPDWDGSRLDLPHVISTLLGRRLQGSAETQAA